MTAPLPAVSVCGWSGSGKTTLIAELVSRLKARGLSVVVIKHDVHGIDRSGRLKDSDRFFLRGADTAVLAPNETLLAFHPGQGRTLPGLISQLDPHYDIILCEGFKSYRFALKIWLQRSEGESPPARAPGIHRILAPRQDRAAIVETMVTRWLEARLKAIPLLGGVLWDGGGPKVAQGQRGQRFRNPASLDRVLKALQERVEQVVLLGPSQARSPAEHLPVLPLARERRALGAAMAAAMRWRADAAWIFVSGRHPRFSAAVLRWLEGLRRPGVWGILVRHPQTRSLRPLLALLEPRARALVERGVSLAGLAADRRVITSTLPDGALPDAD